MMVVVIAPEQNLEELCQNWVQAEERFELRGPFDEFCFIDKKTRIITEFGYSLMVQDWITEGIAILE